jgi:hypothetical protein
VEEIVTSRPDSVEFEVALELATGRDLQFAAEILASQIRRAKDRRDALDQEMRELLDCD